MPQKYVRLNKPKKTPEARLAAMRADYATDPSKAKAAAHAYARTIRGRASRLWTAARVRARQYGLPMEIDVPWIVERLEAGTCALTGINFDLRTEGGRLPYAPSIDRISAARGYTKDNSRVVITAANLAKNVWDDSTLLEWAKALVSKHESAH